MWLVLSGERLEDGAEKYMKNMLETGRISASDITEGRKRAIEFTRAAAAK